MTCNLLNPPNHFAMLHLAAGKTPLDSSTAAAQSLLLWWLSAAYLLLMLASYCIFLYSPPCQILAGFSGSSLIADCLCLSQAAPVDPSPAPALYLRTFPSQMRSWSPPCSGGSLSQCGPPHFANDGHHFPGTNGLALATPGLAPQSSSWCCSPCAGCPTMWAPKTASDQRLAAPSTVESAIYTLSTCFKQRGRGEPWRDETPQASPSAVNASKPSCWATRESLQDISRIGAKPLSKAEMATLLQCLPRQQLEPNAMQRHLATRHAATHSALSGLQAADEMRQVT